MKRFRLRSQDATAVRYDGTIPDGELYGYCGNCGEVTDVILFKHEFVLVNIRGQRPYYGRVIKVDQSDGGPMVFITTGSIETEKISIGNIVKVPQGRMEVTQ